MNIDDRNLQQIKNDMKIISSNKLSMMQSKLLFMGITFEIILRKDLFPKNNDLKGFINSNYVIYFKDKMQFKDYLYVSRTLLGSRVLRKIYSDLEYNQILKVVSKISDALLIEDENKKSKKSDSSVIDKETNEWMKFIRNKV